jgi:hypothetical protein
MADLPSVPGGGTRRVGDRFAFARRVARGRRGCAGLCGNPHWVAVLPLTFRSTHQTGEMSSCVADRGVRVARRFQEALARETQRG